MRLVPVEVNIALIEDSTQLTWECGRHLGKCSENHRGGECQLGYTAKIKED